MAIQTTRLVFEINGEEYSIDFNPLDARITSLKSLEDFIELIEKHFLSSECFVLSVSSSTESDKILSDDVSFDPNTKYCLRVMRRRQDLPKNKYEIELSDLGDMCVIELYRIYEQSIVPSNKKFRENYDIRMLEQHESGVGNCSEDHFKAALLKHDFNIGQAVNYLWNNNGRCHVTMNSFSERRSIQLARRLLRSRDSITGLEFLAGEFDFHGIYGS